MHEFLTSRSRALEYQRCPRSRWWLHEAQGTGYELLRQSVPLVTGAAVHKGLAALLLGDVVEYAVQAATVEYDLECKGRQFNLAELEDQSFVYREQRALVEALVRVAALRVVPKLLEVYEVLEVETLDQAILHEDEDKRITWRSIPDALLRNRADGDLYLLSWKTTAAYDANRAADARVDMQGLSEAWAIEARIADEIKFTDGHGNIAHWIGEAYQTDQLDIRGIQTVYLTKGRRTQVAGQSGQYRTDSPLIYGYHDASFPPKLATSRMWTCSAPTP